MRDSKRFSTLFVVNLFARFGSPISLGSFAAFLVIFSASFLGSASGSWTSFAASVTIDLLFCIDVVLELNTASFSTVEEGCGRFATR
eukprot:581848-Pyramimonas_sp.AAC.2